MPDGRLIAFVNPTPGTAGLFVIDLRGSQLRYLTAGDRPTLSPDGTRIAFINSAPGTEGLYVINVDGSNQHLLSRASNNFAWSVDSQRIIFSNDTANTSTVYSVGLNGFCPANV